MNTPDTFAGKAVLILAHAVGMVDLVALPIWVGTLMQHYHYGPPQAGITVTIFLLGVVTASLLLAPRFNRLPRRVAVSLGFAISAAAFFLVSRMPVDAASFATIVALHGVAGLGVGCGLTFTHGCIGRSRNPHQLFSLASIVLGFAGVIFFAFVPRVLQQEPASMLFVIIASTMAIAAVVAALAFPTIAGDAGPVVRVNAAVMQRIPRAAWFVIGTVVCLTLNQSMVFAFVERIGVERGFGADRVNGVLVALGLINLLPGALAALLQKRWSAVTVGIVGPIGQAVLALTLSSATAFGPYAAATAVYVFMVIFTHNFLFGLLASLDRSGRAAAATPAMLMIGSCIGPVLGGVIIAGLGYQGLGWAACIVAVVAVIAMAQVRRNLSAAVTLVGANA